eukprot:c14972_g1_i1.p1 GENE.c14972_g1_i1~~c14972_g1_i1.p1  ORF type:complete len:155 (+),score=30.65 c14972_g1_i1:1-465(+)
MGQASFENSIKEFIAGTPFAAVLAGVIFLLGILFAIKSAPPGLIFLAPSLALAYAGVTLIDSPLRGPLVPKYSFNAADNANLPIIVVVGLLIFIPAVFGATMPAHREVLENLTLAVSLLFILTLAVLPRNHNHSHSHSEVSISNALFACVATTQ